MCSFTTIKLKKQCCSAQIEQIFFINPRPACPETEKGGEGERDTGRTVKGCRQARIAQGYLLHLLTGQVERCRESPLPDTPLLISMRLQRQICRKASNLEVVSVFFLFFDRTPISRDLWFSWNQWNFRQVPSIWPTPKIWPFWTWRAGTNSRYSTGGESAHKSWALENHSLLGDYMYEIQHISKEENVLISEPERSQQLQILSSLNSKAVLQRVRLLFLRPQQFWGHLIFWICQVFTICRVFTRSQFFTIRRVFTRRQVFSIRRVFARRRVLPSHQVFAIRLRFGMRQVFSNGRVFTKRQCFWMHQCFVYICGAYIFSISFCILI